MQLEMILLREGLGASLFFTPFRSYDNSYERNCTILSCDEFAVGLRLIASVTFDGFDELGTFLIKIVSCNPDVIGSPSSAKIK